MERSEQAQAKLEIFRSAPIPKAVLVNALPAIGVQVMVMIYSVADTFFIGCTGNPYQIAAVSLAMPVFLLFVAMGTLFGIGGTSAISRALGEGRFDHAKKLSSFCMWGSILVGVVLAGVILLSMDGLLNILGATENTAEYTRTYLTIVTLCGPFAVVANAFSNIIRAEGESTRAMTGLAIGNLINVVLDPVMILLLNWQVAGAALATVIGNVFAALYYLLWFLRGKSTLSISPRDFAVRDKVCTGVLSIGIPAALGFLLMTVSTVVLNHRVAAYNDLALAGVGIASKVAYMNSSVGMGFGQGVQPLFGYCIGAKLNKRFKKSLSFSLWTALVLSCVLTGLCYLFTHQIVGVFLSDATAADYGVLFSRILISTSFLIGIQYVLTYAMQAMGVVSASLIVNVCRQGVFFLPLLFLLERLIGINGLLWAQPAADVLMAVVSAVMMVYLMRRRIAD